MCVGVDGRLDSSDSNGDLVANGIRKGVWKFAATEFEGSEIHGEGKLREGELGRIGLVGKIPV